MLEIKRECNNKDLKKFMLVGLEMNFQMITIILRNQLVGWSGNFFKPTSENMKQLENSFEKRCQPLKNISGWHVVLKCAGYQSPHIHPVGWVSGVIYLKVVPSLGKDEGAIEFGLNGKDYYYVNSPSLKIQPKEGDIVLFPSSLHHKTIPFSTYTDRINISFDLIPESTRIS